MDSAVMAGAGHLSENVISGVRSMKAAKGATAMFVLGRENEGN